MWIALAVTAALAGEVVFDRTGRYGRVVVEQDGSRRTLTIDGALQSTWDPEDPGLGYGYQHAAALAVHATAPTTDDHALIVGLGGGTFTRHLRERYGVTVRAVELDPLVLRAARRWFALDPAVRVTVGDGRRAIERDRRRYDVVFVDAASEDGVPAHLLTLEFLEAVRARLTPDGVALANSWAEAPFADDELATWHAAFGDVVVVRYATDDEENRVLVAGPGLPASWAPDLLPEVVDPARVEVRRPTSAGSVLRDPT